MSQKSMIIIGGGLAGLATGCYASMNGYKTQIFEQHSVPGGLCTAWKRNGYTIDGCIHFLVGCQQNSPFYSLYQELGILKDNQFRILNEFSSFLDEETRQKLVVTGDLKRLSLDMKKIAPYDEEAINKFISGCHNIMEIFRVPTKTIEFMKNYNMTVNEYAQRFQNPLLTWYISKICLPEMPMYSLFMILGLLSVGQLGLVEGGSLKLSLDVAQKYLNLGGEIKYGVYVEEILVENKTAVGVRLADGSIYRADVIVSACDGFSTIYQMLGGKNIDQNIQDRYDHSPLHTPLNMVSFGVARQFPGEPSETIIRLKQPLNSGGKNIDEIRLRIFNYDTSFAPYGKTVVQALIYTDFDYWYNLHEEKPLYEKEKQRVADTVLQRLENLYPGISSLIEMTDVATPYTLWRYTRNHRGSWEGWLATPETVRKAIPITLPGLADFYMVGQWVLPAAGVPQVLNSGRNLVKLLCEQEGKEFSEVI